MILSWQELQSKSLTRTDLGGQQEARILGFSVYFVITRIILLTAGEQRVQGHCETYLRGEVDRQEVFS